MVFSRGSRTCTKIASVSHSYKDYKIQALEMLCESKGNACALALQLPDYPITNYKCLLFLRIEGQRLCICSSITRLPDYKCLLCFL